MSSAPASHNMNPLLILSLYLVGIAAAGCLLGSLGFVVLLFIPDLFPS